MYICWDICDKNFLYSKKEIQEDMVFFLPLNVVISGVMAGIAAAILPLA